LISVCFAASLHRVKQNRVQGSYLVVFKNEVSQATLAADLKEIQDIHNVTFQYTYENAIKGFAGQLTSDQLAAMLNHPNVDFVEEDQVVHAFQFPGTGCTLGEHGENYDWGLSRVCAYNSQLDNFYSTPDAARQGEGVTAFIIDTGIYLGHSDFQGRAVFGYKATPSWSDGDGNGHGTHVASTVGGWRYGVASKAKLVTIKVLGDDGSGTIAGVVAGVNYVHGNCPSGTRCTGNMSLGGGFSAALNNACNSVVATGTVMVVAAGNENQNACNVSPASATEVITTASLDQGPNPTGDARSYFSNWGTCCKIFGPGSNILGAWIGTPTATRTISGTSMASPHVCGVTALILAENPNLTVAQVKDFLYNTGARDLIELNCGSAACQQTPNIVVQNGCNRNPQ
jgi:subtilisin family serine protease